MAQASIPDTAARILVVDGDRAQGQIISTVATQSGYRVTCVSTLDAAAEAVASQSFECVTVDLVLGERDGIELLRLLSGLAKTPRVIVVSGCDERILNASIRMAHALGVQNATWLSKPLDFDLLKSTLMLHPDAQPQTSCRAKSLFKPDESHIRQALESDEFFPLFQPKIQISDSKVIGCEALARWTSPHFGEIAPDLFIPVAEQARLIKPLTIKLLENSLLAAKQFIQNDPSFMLAVNLSASLLSDLGLPEQIEKLLADHDFPTSSLILEITESVAMSDVQLAMDVLLRLRIRGIGISMDDFGTGYSSLSALARLPFTEIKIDRSFVSTCLQDDDMWKIVRGAVVLGHELKLKVVAEGVENRATQQALRTIGCDIGQGYYFSPALSAPEFLTWRDSWHRRAAKQRAA